jgi:FAD/FMN-containing dehydrogenase
VLRFYTEFMRDAPDELNGFFAFLTVPPGPPFPEPLHLQKMCGVVWCYVGGPNGAAAALEPVRAFAKPVLDGVVEMPFPALQSAFDELYPPGHQWYWRADFVREIPDEAISRHLAFAERLPTMQSTMHLYPVDGAAGRVSPGETAWSYRDARFAQVIVGVDPDPSNASEITRWTIDYWEALHEFSLGGAYTNALMDEGPARIRASYGENYDRLARIKATYDPANLFHVNQNITPTRAGARAASGNRRARSAARS